MEKRDDGRGDVKNSVIEGFANIDDDDLLDLEIGVED